MEPPVTTNTSKHVALLIATMGSFLTPFTASSVNIALPSIGTRLSLNALELSWVATAYILAAATFLVPFGRLSDIYGRKRVFQVGILIDAIASVACAVSNSGGWLILFRALQGLGGAMIFGTGVAILTSVYPANERGKALGINAAAVYTGLSVGPLVGGFLTGHLGWRSIFLLNALLGFVTTVTVFWKLKGEWAGAKGEKFDYIGSLIYSLALVTTMYAFSVLPALWAYWLILFGLLGFTAFVKWEIRSTSPVLDIMLFRQNIVFAMSSLAALINFSATFAVGFLLSLYLQYIKGFSPEHAGLILIVQPVIQVIFSPVAGSLSDRVEPRILASIGMAVTTVGMAMLTLLNVKSSLEFVIICLIVLGLGFCFFLSPNLNALMSSVERKYYGVAAGMIGTMRLTGQAFSMGMTLLLFALNIGRVQITPEYYPSFLKSMTQAFSISTLLCGAGIIASIARGKTRR